MESVRAAVSVYSLPPCGGGLGRGWFMRATQARQTVTPTPSPSPQGGGEHTRCAALVCIKHKQTCLSMRFIVMAMIACLPMALAPAWAQTPSVVNPPRAIAPDDLREYC